MTLTFERPDLENFPCLEIAYAAGRAGGGAPAMMSGANEIAVEAFLAGRLPWLGIAEVVGHVASSEAPGVSTVEDVIAADQLGRTKALQFLDAND